LTILASIRSFFCFDSRVFDFFVTRLRTGSFLAIRVAISLLTRDTPDCFSSGGSVGMMSGGVACRRPLRVRSDLSKKSVHDHVESVPFFCLAMTAVKRKFRSPLPDGDRRQFWKSRSAAQIPDRRSKIFSVMHKSRDMRLHHRRMR